MKKGEKFLTIGEYYDAAAEFKVAYSKTPAKERAKRGERARKLAYCYDRINSDAKAIAAYRNVIRYNKDRTAGRTDGTGRKRGRLEVYRKEDGHLQLTPGRLFAHAFRRRV